MPRIFCTSWLSAGPVTLDEAASRHVQVLRMQPGGALTLFDGMGGQWQASVTQMGRKTVDVLVHGHEDVDCELPTDVHLVVGMMASERMDWLVEKATELGAARITVFVAERSNLRLNGERAGKKLEHWQSAAQSACAQCGRNVVPQIAVVQDLDDVLEELAAAARPQTGAVGAPTHLLLSLAADWGGLAPKPAPPAKWAARGHRVVTLSGPEGGLTREEERAAIQNGFAPITLGPRVLRAETAPLAVLGWVGLAGLYF